MTVVPLVKTSRLPVYNLLADSLFVLAVGFSHNVMRVLANYSPPSSLLICGWWYTWMRGPRAGRSLLDNETLYSTS